MRASRRSEEEEEELVMYGYLQDSIVGVQYYEGEVNNNEMVELVREPDNQYDNWAIRVDNVRGQKVGHLPRVLVCHLAPLVDQGSLHLEGLVPRGAHNIYKIPIHIYCFGTADNRQRVVDRLRRAGKIGIVPAMLLFGHDFQELVAGSGPRPRLNADPEVLTPLYPHQQEALAFMCQRENSNGLPPFWEPRLAKEGGPLSYVSSLTNFIAQQRPAPLRGGILADDMGLGKTLEIISLICTNRPGVTQLNYFTADDANQPSGSGAAGAAAEGQQAAAAEGSEDGGEERRPNKRQRKGKAKVGEQAAGTSAAAAAAGGSKGGKLQQEAAERAAAEEPPPSLPAAGGPRGTLIVCPLSVVSNWQMQIEEHTAGNLSVCVYHGPDRDKRVSVLSQYDVVLTTYNTLAAEASAKNGVCRVDWLRVVLDEAHIIKNPKTQMAKAAHALKAQRRWAVTGTPVQNSLQDLHGMCRFLHVDTLEERSLFVRCIERPIKNREPLGLKRLQARGAAEQRWQQSPPWLPVQRSAARHAPSCQELSKPLYSPTPCDQVLMATIAMRRTKDTQVHLDGEARAKYERWQAAGRAVIEQHLRDGTLLQQYTAVLEILLRLRQICCHPDLAPGEDPSFLAQQDAPPQLTPEVAAQLVQLLRAGLDDECPVCLNEMAEPCITLCKHIFCRRCISMVISRDKPSCPLCRGPVAERDLVLLPPEEPDPTQDASPSGTASTSSAAATAGAACRSAKVAALIERLKQDAAAAAAAAAAGAHTRPVKSVVFSQFTSFLDIVEPALAAAGFATARLDGKTPAKRRGELLRNFASGAASAPTVLLVSLKAGGVGLNLVAASRVHLLDPWWNPSVEEQAMDRVHRLGQQQDVHVYRYSVEDSIEERMLALQEQKRDLMKASEAGGGELMKARGAGGGELMKASEAGGGELMKASEAGGGGWGSC
ncbi:hypothetical protein COHA_004482 [Chlorella ohadii]|uniref:Uncharacterized protein n=1 Tax=Chlorella ohadii TaxID=2649997 RepID=A0AAD5H6H0_9CHLO|nr:hypothetical protein COHA_004482 [Chlorella ohadii]